MKVLLIAHSCQVRHEGQQRAQQLGLLPDVELRVVAPDRWYDYGSWREFQPPLSPSYVMLAEKIRFPWAGPAQWYFHHYPRLGEVLRSFRPDIIDLWEEPWGLVSVHACWLRNRLLPAAKIVSETEANIARTHPFPFKQFREYTLRNTDYAVARQREGIDVLRAKGYTGRAEVVGNAVDAGLFRPLDRDACKRALGVSGFVVGYVGRFTEAKGLMDIVEAMAILGPEAGATFVLIGSGEFQEKLERRIADLALGKVIRFFPARKLEQLPEVMNALDALALVSRTTATWKEQFGRVIIEAHACATPVIGSDSGAIPEVVNEGGLVVREGNPAEIAAAIRTLMNDPALRRKMGFAGRRQVEDFYTWQRVSERMRDIYCELMSQDRTARSPAHV